MSGKVAYVFSVGGSMKPQLINNFPIAAFRAFKNFGSNLEGNFNTEFVRPKQVSNNSSWEGF